MISNPMAMYAVVAAALLGHFAIHLAIYNRVNSFGWPRVIIKRIVKVFLVSCITLPIIAAVTTWPLVNELLSNRITGHALTSVGWFWKFYAILCIAVIPLLGIPWILWRPILALESVNVARNTVVTDITSVVRYPLALTTKCRIARRIPGNQIFELAVEQIELPVNQLPEELDGYRIAHFSDLHFTGDISSEMTSLVVDQANQWAPDLVALTGDIIDHGPCISWLRDALSHAQAPDGCFFVLGNHDTRVAAPQQIRDEMVAIGWRDIGGSCCDMTLRGDIGEGVRAQILGNELPWFSAPSTDQVLNSTAAFRLLLSHSPDQLWWARRHGVHLMLAGHTHGGQGRLPLAGPLLSPSWHGSRFASGEFYKAPTTLHVSRGISGTHLLRINCRPQLSLLTLRVRAT